MQVAYVLIGTRGDVQPMIALGTLPDIIQGVDLVLGAGIVVGVQTVADILKMGFIYMAKFLFLPESIQIINSLF